MNDAIELNMPLRLISLLNAREHWGKRAKRAVGHRTTAREYLETHSSHSSLSRSLLSGSSVIVTITRIAPRELDDDNLAGSGKHVRDGIADALGMDDRDPRVKWLYAQRKGLPYQYACHVRIEVAE